MNTYKPPRGLRNIRTSLTGDKSGNENRIVAMRRLIKLETQRNRLSLELQKCLQKQHQLREQLEDIIFDVEEIQKVLGEEITVDSGDGGRIRSKLRAKALEKSDDTKLKKFIIEY